MGLINQTLLSYPLLLKGGLPIIVGILFDFLGLHILTKRRDFLPWIILIVATLLYTTGFLWIFENGYISGHIELRAIELVAILIIFGIGKLWNPYLRTHPDDKIFRYAKFGIYIIIGFVPLTFAFVDLFSK